MQAGLVPEKYINDAIHLALASVNKMEVLVSWNMEHIVKLKTIVGVNKYTNNDTRRGAGMKKKSKTMDELHKIREEMSKMTEKEKAELLESVREKYKDMIYEKEQRT